METEVHLTVEVLRPQLTAKKPDLGFLDEADEVDDFALQGTRRFAVVKGGCLLYTSPSPRDRTRSRMPSSA